MTGRLLTPNDENPLWSPAPERSRDRESRWPGWPPMGMKVAGLLWWGGAPAPRGALQGPASPASAGASARRWSAAPPRRVSGGIQMLFRGMDNAIAPSWLRLRPGYFLSNGRSGFQGFFGFCIRTAAHFGQRHLRCLWNKCPRTSCIGILHLRQVIAWRSPLPASHRRHSVDGQSCYDSQYAPSSAEARRLPPARCGSYRLYEENRPTKFRRFRRRVL